ncbi:hypothetical protein [Glaciimonas immobilis]|uniref:DUF721 domain-containing protein n=1 Tax=Glaciimonas immobilis TaxID=728004 RepID=A0A840RUB3_9BURK|nr:hypothetical protein [Glaciimonas immobilis]KAF3999679.1 hypothetical protein HAV38_00305 [Glaciimonas immobilis]MBB5200120.1 hypothetical protein [Glaciimonas immobilis]
MRKLSFSSTFGQGPTGSNFSKSVSREAADFLRGNDKMAALLPTLTRMAALQKQCAAGLPNMFEACEVLHFEGGQLVLSAPNAALATKLKQQLPKLQNYLLTENWQVNGIRIKVQVSQKLQKLTPVKQFSLTPQAVSAFDTLASTLESSPRNEALKAALASLVRRYKEEQSRK